MSRIHANNFITTTDGSINDTDVSVDLTDVTGFPAIGGGVTANLTLQGGDVIEIVTATAISTNTLTITRGAEGTTPVSWADNSSISIRPTADSVDRKEDLISGRTLSTATVASNDKVIIQDTSDSDNVKTVTAQDIADLATGGGGSPGGASLEVQWNDGAGGFGADSGFAYGGTGSLYLTTSVQVGGNNTSAGFVTFMEDSDNGVNSVKLIAPSAVTSNRVATLPDATGTIALTSDITNYTDEMAQDAVGAMVDSSLVYTDGTPLLQRAALTGDVTASAGSNSTTIANGAVTLAKMANMATASLIYRKTASSGAPEVNTLATLKTDLGLTGTNSGDQTSIVGISGTKAQFDTACSDGNFVYTTTTAFLAQRTTSQTIATATDTKIQFATEAYDTGSYYDNATNYRYTPGIAGYYNIYTNLIFTNTIPANTLIIVQIWKNGALYAESIGFSSGTTNYAGFYLGAGIPMNGSTDYVEVYVRQHAGSNQDLLGGSAYNYFGGVLAEKS